MKKSLVGLLAAVLFLARPVLGVTQLIVNGDFSADPPSLGWGYAENNYSTNGINFEPGYLSMGNVADAIQQVVEQQITIPSDTLAAEFSYVLSGTSKVGKNEGNFFTEIIDPKQNSQLTNFAIVSNGNFSNTMANFGLVGLAGQTIAIDFYTQVNPGVSNISFDLTDVSVLAYNSNDIPANDNFANSTFLGGVPRARVFATNVLATKEVGEVNIATNNGGHSVWWTWNSPSNGLAFISTAGSTFNTLLGVYTGNSLNNLTLVASTNGGTGSQVIFPIVPGTTYHIAVDGADGATGVVQLNIAAGADVTPPTVTIKSPAANATVTNSTLVVQGTASDNTAVGQVQVQLFNAGGSNQVQIATGTNTWSATLTNLLPGTNLVSVVAFDIVSNESSAITRLVNYAPVSPLSLTILGTGTVSPNLTNMLLYVGSNYTLTAKGGSGEVFSNWSGDVTATTPTITFTMQNNMRLWVNFVPTPFPTLTGVYQGIFSDYPVQHTNSGFFNGTVASSGAFTAKVILAGKSYSMSGQFSAGGEATATIVRKGLPTVTAQLSMDMSGAGIYGALSDGSFLSRLDAQRAMTNAAALAGNYTVLIPGADFTGTEPGGFSYGTVTVTPTGGLTFAGELADGTKVSQKTFMRADGTWACYSPLYSGGGSIFGFMSFINMPGSDFTGPVVWFKPQSNAKLYPQGFAYYTNAVGSLFTNASPVMNFSLGTVTVYGDPLNGGVTNQIILSASNVVTNNSQNALSLTIATKTGTFKGSVAVPNSVKPISFNGVVLQKQNFGGGFFLGTTESGNLIFKGEP